MRSPIAHTVGMAFASNVGIVVGLLAGSLLAGPARVQLYPAPELNVSQLARDRHGFIWLAAEKGLFRFDGWHYHAVPGFPFRGARFIAIGPDGIVWAGGQQGLARRTPETWKVITTDPIEGMALSTTGLWVNAGGLRLVKPDGTDRRFPEAKPSGELVSDAEGVLWFPCGPNVCTLRPPDFSLEVRRISAPGPWQKVTPEQGGRRYWLSSRESIALVEEGIVKSRQAALAPSLPDISSLLDAALASDVRAEPGLRRWQLFSMTAVVALFADPSKLWFWAGDQLAYSQRSADWEVWQGEAFTSTTPEGFLPVPGHDAPLLLTDRGVFELTPENRQWQRRPAASMVDLMDMLEDRHGGYWATARDEGLVRLNRDFAVVERFPTLCAAVDSTRALLRDGQGRTWVGGKAPNCFFEIQGEPGHWKFVPQKLPEATVSATTIVADAQGRPWVGYEYGIASLQDSGAWQRIETSEPVTLVRSIEFDGPDTLWVAHRRPGTFTRLQRQGNQWRVERFPAERYGAIQTEYIRRDSRGWIWRGTLNGEVRIARPGHYEPGEWLHINYANGLASKSISLQGWFEDTSGSIWLAGSTSGVTRVRPTEAWFAAPRAQPVITRLSAAGQTWFDPERIPHQVPSDGPLEIDLSTIDANPFQPAPLRYRWQGSAWKLSTDGHLSMANLPPGNAALFTASRGPAMVRSASDGVAGVQRDPPRRSAIQLSPKSQSARTFHAGRRVSSAVCCTVRPSINRQRIHSAARASKLAKAAKASCAPN